jgi:O-Antigen ligase
MPPSEPIDDEQPSIHPALRWPIMLLIGTVVAAAGVAPLWIPVLLGLLSLAVFESELWTDRLGWPQGVDAAVLVAGAGVCVWMVMGSLWALKPSSALTHPFIFFAYLAVVVSLSAWFARLPSPDRVAMLKPVLIGGASAIAFLLLEAVTRGAISASVMALIMRMTSLETANAPSDGMSSTVSVFFFNRHVAACVLVLPAILFTCTLILRGAVRRSVVALLLVATASILAMSESATAILGFVAGCCVYGIARWRPQRALAAVTGGFAIMLVLAPVLAVVPDRLGLADARWLPESFRDRVGIWQWQVDSLAHRSWQGIAGGIGVHGTQSLDAAWMTANGNPQDIIGKPRPSRHPHNGFLEIWSELGVVGMALSLIFGLATLRTIARYPQRSQPFLITLAAAALGIAATGWSLWQPWLLASLALGSLLIVWGALTLPVNRNPAAAPSLADLP